MPLHVLLPLAATEAPPADVKAVVLSVICGIAVAVFFLVGHAVLSQSWESYEEKYLEEASRDFEDVFITIPPQQLMLISAGAGLVLTTLIFLLTENLLIGIIVGLLGLGLPKIGLEIFKARRTKKFTDQLVEALQTLSNSLRSGFALPRAFKLVADESPKPLAQEFKILTQELRLGREMEEAMRNMYGRVPSEDLDLLITSITISQSVGGNLAEVFDKIAAVIRERHRIEGRIDALTAQGRIQGIVVGLLPGFMFMMIYYMDAQAIEPLYTTWRGYGVIAVILFLEFMGFFFIKKIMDIEV